MVEVIQAINCKILLERLGYRSHNSSAPWGFVSFETEGYLFICMGFFSFLFPMLLQARLSRTDLMQNLFKILACKISFS